MEEHYDHCKHCGLQLSEFTRARALLWDGALWRVYPYIDDAMKWGPYCQTCALRLVDKLNRGDFALTWASQVAGEEAFGA
jgi:hypothetical protein